MVFQPVGNTASATLVYNVDGGPDINNTLYFKDDAVPWDGAGLADLAADLEAWWNAEVKPLQVALCVLTSIKTRDLEAEFPYHLETAVGTPGTRAGSPAPATVASIVEFLGDPGSAPRSGKIFHPGMAEADIDANLQTQGYVDAVQAAYDGARSMGGAPISRALVLVSRYNGYTLFTKADGTVVKRPTKRVPAIVNTIGDVQVPRRYGIVKKRRPSPL